LWVPLLGCPLLGCPLLCCGVAFGQTPEVLSARASTRGVLANDKKEAVRDRGAAGYLRLEAIQSRPVASARKPAPKQ